MQSYWTVKFQPKNIQTMKRFFISLALLFVALTTFAQTVLPVDPNVRIGKLENGLTYNIRHND